MGLIGARLYVFRGLRFSGPSVLRSVMFPRGSVEHFTAGNADPRPWARSARSPACRHAPGGLALAPCPAGPAGWPVPDAHVRRTRVAGVRCGPAATPRPTFGAHPGREAARQFGLVPDTAPGEHHFAPPALCRMVGRSVFRQDAPSPEAVGAGESGHTRHGIGNATPVPDAPGSSARFRGSERPSSP